MDMSEEVKNIFTALSKAQGQFVNPTKDSDGYGYKYADLADCINAGKKHLAENGLAVTQFVGSDEAGNPNLTTLLTHTSGEWLRTVAHIPIATLEGNSGRNPAQVMGASITYMRRYQYAAIIGLAQEDDDAASAQQGPRKHNQKPQQQRQQKPQQQGDELPWLNKPELDDMTPGIVAKIAAGERTHQQVLDNLKTRYRLNKATESAILNIQVEAPAANQENAHTQGSQNAYKQAQTGGR